MFLQAFFISKPARVEPRDALFASLQNVLRVSKLWTPFKANLTIFH
jgi:hypothetical protein